jgi:hypothetical protein
VTPETPEGQLVFVLTGNNLAEGGRPRDPDEMYLNLNEERAEAVGPDPVLLHPDDGGDVIEVFASGHAGHGAPTPKNLRSRPGVDMGKWLRRRHARPTDYVTLVELPPAESGMKQYLGVVVPRALLARADAERGAR